VHPQGRAKLPYPSFLLFLFYRGIEMPKKLYQYAAYVAYQDALKASTEKVFPVVAADPRSAADLAFDYVLRVLRLDDFELRVVGA